jgi:hypothetical protein
MAVSLSARPDEQFGPGERDGFEGIPGRELSGTGFLGSSSVRKVASASRVGGRSDARRVLRAHGTAAHPGERWPGEAPVRLPPPRAGRQRPPRHRRRRLEGRSPLLRPRGRSGRQRSRGFARPRPRATAIRAHRRARRSSPGLSPRPALCSRNAASQSGSAGSSSDGPRWSSRLEKPEPRSSSRPASSSRLMGHAASSSRHRLSRACALHAAARPGASSDTGAPSYAPNASRSPFPLIHCSDSGRAANNSSDSRTVGHRPRRRRSRSHRPGLDRSRPAPPALQAGFRRTRRRRRVRSKHSSGPEAISATGR